MKLWLKFGVFIAFIFALAFVAWLFLVEKPFTAEQDFGAGQPAQTPTNADESEQNETALNSQDLQDLLNLQDLPNSQSLHALRGLPNSQDSLQTPPHLQAFTPMNTQKRIRGLFVDYYAENLDDLSAFADESDFEENASVNFKPNVALFSAFDEMNLSFDANKMGLFAQYRDIFSPIQSDFWDFFSFEKAGKSESATTSQSINGAKPKLCIIIDDMASREQVRELKATGLKLSPSFFPADKNHPKTPALAREFEFFMVHLPLSAVHYSYEERETLTPEHSQEYINAKIAQISRDFRGLKFINNHTGSLFTDDTKAMRKLFRALKQHDLIFVDSITIGSSKGALMSKEFSQMPIKRDIFLDNDSDIDAIKAQIQHAIDIAHKKGFAIAIAHPRKNTFQALVESKNLLQSVELVYLDELYENP